MEQIINYVKPELLVLSVVLYFIGFGLKKTQTLTDKYIPVILGVVGIILCAIWLSQHRHLEPDRKLQWLYLLRSFKVFWLQVFQYMLIKL